METIKITSALPLGLENIDTKFINSICIIGNTFGIFGDFKVTNGKITPPEKWTTEVYNAVKFISCCKEKTILIIGDEETIKYHRTVFNWILENVCKCKLRINYLDINIKKYKGNYLTCIKDIKKYMFDVIIMNPPYGSTGSNTIHLNITEKCLFFGKHVFSIFPFTFVTKLYNDTQNEYKEKFKGKLSKVTEINSSVFEGTKMPNVGIYEFVEESENIQIEYENGKNISVISLLGLTTFSKYETNIIQFLNKKPQEILKDVCRLNSWKKSNESLTNLINEKCNKYKKEFNTKVGLIVNRANGARNGKAFSKNTGNIFTSLQEYFDWFINHPISIGTNVLLFNSKKEAKQCKIALQNPLLRFTIYKLQDDQNMTARVYSLIPAIDWEDPRVVTDEGLLEVCGCPKDKCKEYAEYCKNYMEKVDNGTLNS